MKRFVVLLSLLASITAFAASNTTPVGYWKQIDDHTHKPQSIMHIWQKDHKLYGNVVAGFKINGEAPRQTCNDCPKPFGNKKILGMQILWGFSKDDNDWDGGRILDPNKGSTYRCTLKVEDQGQKLHVHGYIGIPLFGRTQVWERLSAKQAHELSKHAYNSLFHS